MNHHCLVAGLLTDSTLFGSDEGYSGGCMRLSLFSKCIHGRIVNII